MLYTIYIIVSLEPYFPYCWRIRAVLVTLQPGAKGTVYFALFGGLHVWDACLYMQV